MRISHLLPVAGIAIGAVAGCVPSAPLTPVPVRTAAMPTAVPTKTLTIEPTEPSTRPSTPIGVVTSTFSGTVAFLPADITGQDFSGVVDTQGIVQVYGPYYRPDKSPYHYAVISFYVNNFPIYVFVDAAVLRDYSNSSNTYDINSSIYAYGKEFNPFTDCGTTLLNFLSATATGNNTYFISMPEVYGRVNLLDLYQVIGALDDMFVPTEEIKDGDIYIRFYYRNIAQPDGTTTKEFVHVAIGKGGSEYLVSKKGEGPIIAANSETLVDIYTPDGYSDFVINRAFFATDIFSEDPDVFLDNMEKALRDRNKLVIPAILYQPSSSRMIPPADRGYIYDRLGDRMFGWSRRLGHQTSTRRVINFA